MGKHGISRRALLRGVIGGASAALALPTLDAMLGSGGTAYADGTTLPLCYGTWWWGCGGPGSNWTPAATGAGYAPSPVLMPLAGVRDYVSVVSGLDLHTPMTLEHHSPWATMVSGSSETTNAGRPGDGNFIEPSLDQIIARAWGATALPATLPLVAARVSAAGNATYCVGVSQRGMDSVNTPFDDPRAVFTRLFGADASMPRPDPRSVVLAPDRSLLDGFVAEASAMRARLGASDQTRLDRYLSDLRDIEQRLAAMPPASGPTCAIPDAPADPGGDVSARARLLADLLVAAMHCGQTRVFAYEFTPMQTEYVFANVGARVGFHTLTHNGNGDGSDKFVMMQRVVTYVMTELAYLLERMRATTEGAGTLLDRCAVYATTELHDGATHGKSDIPILVAGRAGTLRGGVHYRGGGESVSRVGVTLFRALGVPVTSWGAGGGETSAVIDEILR